MKKGAPYSERGYFKLMIKMYFETIPFEGYLDYVKIAKVDLKFYYPLLQSQASLTIEEPCFIVKFIRLISLTSEYLRDMELSFIFGNLLSRHQPKNIFTNIDVVINSSFQMYEKHFYMTVLKCFSKTRPAQKFPKLTLNQLNSSSNLIASQHLKFAVEKRDLEDVTPGVNMLKKTESFSWGRSPKNTLIQDNNKNPEVPGSYSPGSSKLIPIHDKEAVVAQKIIKLQKMVDEEDETNVKRLPKDFELLSNNYVLTNMDKPKVKVSRLSFKLHSVVRQESMDVQTFRVIKNVEGYLNITFQKSINSIKTRVYHLDELPQEKVKERLLINDQSSKNSLVGMFNCKEDILSFVQPLNGLGKCHLRVSMLYTKIDYKTKTVSASDLEKDKDQEMEAGSGNLDRINIHTFYEDLCARIRMMGRLLNDCDSFSSLKEPTEENSALDMDTIRQSPPTIIDPPNIKTFTQNNTRNVAEVKMSPNKSGLQRVHRILKPRGAFVMGTSSQKRESPIIAKKDKPIIQIKMSPLNLRGKLTEKGSPLKGKQEKGFKIFPMRDSIMSGKELSILKSMRGPVVSNLVLASAKYDEAQSSLRYLELDHKQPEIEDKPHIVSKFSPLQSKVPIPFGNSRAYGRASAYIDQKPLAESANEESSSLGTHRLFKKEETLLLSIQIAPINFKYRQHKIILNAQDINQIIDMREFFSYAFQTTDNTELDHKLGITNPKLVFVTLLRYISMKLEMTKTALFRLPSFRKVVGERTVIMKNVFNKYEHNTNIMISGFLDKVSSYSIVLYSGVKRCRGTYFIVTVKLDVSLNLLHFKIYNPKVLRTFLLEVYCSSLLSQAQDFYIKVLFPLLLDGELEKIFSSYQNFCEAVQKTEMISPYSKSKKLLSADVLDESFIPDSSMQVESNEGMDKINVNPHENGKQMSQFNTPRVTDRSQVLSVSGFAEAAERAKIKKKSVYKIFLKESPQNLLKDEKSFKEVFQNMQDFFDDQMFIKLFYLWDGSISNSRLSISRFDIL